MYIFLLIIMNLFWAGSYTAVKWGLTYMDPFHMVFARMIIGAVVLFLFSKCTILPFKIIMRCALLGAIVALAQTLGTIGTNMSHATDAAILYALEPIAAIVYARILLKERMDARRWLALALALVGFAILSDVSAGGFLKNLVLIGNALMFIGVLIDGAFSSVAKPVVIQYPPMAVLATTLFFAALFLMPLAVTAPIRHETFSWQSLASLFYLAIICTTIGWTLWLYVLRKLPVNVISLTVFLQPVFGPVISYFVLGEQMGSRIWFGGGVILAAVLIAVLKTKKDEMDLIAEPNLP